MKKYVIAISKEGMKDVSLGQLEKDLLDVEGVEIKVLDERGKSYTVEYPGSVEELRANLGYDEKKLFIIDPDEHITPFPKEPFPF